MAAFGDPEILPGKAAAYLAAVRQHRETIFSTLFGGKGSRKRCQPAFRIIATTRSGPDASNDLYNEVRLGAVFNP